MEKSKDKMSKGIEVIASSGSKQKLERRKLPRLSLTSEQFRLTKSNKIYSVTDLSEQGMGFWLIEPSETQSFFVGLLLEGILNLKREKFAVHARIRNLSPDRVGCEFEKVSIELAQALSDFLSPEMMGSELKPIPASEQGTLWYHGPSGTDLIFYRGPDGKYRKWILYFFGKFVQWEEGTGLLTGCVLPSQEDRSEIRGILRFETLFLDEDSMNDSEKLKIAKKILVSSNLPLDLKNWCIRQIER